MAVRFHAIVVAAVPVGAVIVLDPGGWSPFGPAKWMAISTLGVLAGGLALRLPAARFERCTWWCWVMMLTLLAAGALFGGDFKTALLGSPERHFGLLTWLLLWLMFMCGQRLADDDVRVVLLGCGAAAVALGMYCVVELCFGAPVAVASTTHRLVGPFGSSAFTGAAACVLAPIAVGLVINCGSRSIRFIGLIGAVGSGVALIGSGSRAAYVGIGVALAIAVIARRPQARSVLIGLAVGVALVIAVFATLGSVVQRDYGATSRLDEWTVATRVITGHPLIGVGPEGYRIHIAEGIDSTYERKYGRDVTLPDRAHSAPLDVALSGGVGAGLIYAAMVVLVCQRAFGLMRDGGGVQRGLAVGVIAYAVQQLFLFPLAEFDPVWWLLCGIVISATRPIGSAVTEPVAGVRDRAIVSTVALLVVPLALVAGTFDVAADRLTKQALVADAAGNSVGAIDDAQRAALLRPDNVVYKFVGAEVSLRRGTIADIDHAIALSRAALRWSPHDPFAADELATALLERANVTGLTVDKDAALAEWRVLVARDPHRARWQLQLGRAAVLTGDVQLARHAWTAAAGLAPQDPTAQQLLDALAART